MGTTRRPIPPWTATSTSEGCVNEFESRFSEKALSCHVSCGMYGIFASAFQEEILSSIDGPPLCAGEEEGRVQSVVSHDIISYNILATILCRLLAFSRVNVFLRPSFSDRTTDNLHAKSANNE